MRKTIMITGGAGFIGSNAAGHFAQQGWQVHLFDDLSRPGSKWTLDYLLRETPCHFTYGNVASRYDVEKWFTDVGQIDAVLHLAGQTAVTVSVAKPRRDFEANAVGSFNVMEAAREYAPEAIILYASTNKVYGALSQHEVVQRNGRYDFARGSGVDEEELLDYDNPYACSKGTGDQYARAYGRVYGLRTVIVRQSCIYGIRQLGLEDQGWVAWFAIAGLMRHPLTIYGDGRQSRDLLWIDDLLDLYDKCIDGPEPGSVYNVGGGYENCHSLLDIIAALETHLGQRFEVQFAPARVGDQKVFFADNTKAFRELGWAPRVTIKEGLPLMLGWMEQHRDVIELLMAQKATTMAHNR